MNVHPHTGLIALGAGLATLLLAAASTPMCAGIAIALRAGALIPTAMLILAARDMARPPVIMKEASIMRHKDPSRRTRTGILIPLTLALIPFIALGAAAWLTPATLIPLPKQTRECTVTGGGTLRIRTSDCGTLYYRGHISLDAGSTVTVTTTGPIAWSIQP